MDKIKELLVVEIDTEFDKLSDLDVGSDEYKVAVDGLTKLVDRAIEIEKIEVDAEQKESDRNHDGKLKREQMADTKKDRLITNGIAIAAIVIPSMITIWGTMKTLKFEETGTVTTTAGRNFISRLFPKK